MRITIDNPESDGELLGSGMDGACVFVESPTLVAAELFFVVDVDSNQSNLDLGLF